MTTTPKLGAYNYRFVAIAAGIGIVFSLMLHFMDMTYEQSPIIQTIDILIPSTLAIMAIVSFKKDNGGILRLGQALKIGVGVFFVSGIVGFIYLLIFANLIEPNFAENIAQLQAEGIREASPELDESIVQMQKENIEKYFYIGYFVFILTPSLIIGLIVGLVTGLFTKKN